MNFSELPLTKNRIRDDLSTLLFLHYGSKIYPEASRKFRTLLKSELRENPLAFPVQSQLIDVITEKQAMIVRSFRAEPTVSLAHGYPARILRLLCSGNLTLKRLSAIEKDLETLKSIGHRKGNSIFWVSHFTHGGHSEVAIGLTLHRGMGGLVSILSLCHSLGIKRALTLELLTGAINQILLIDAVTRKGLPVNWGNANLPVYVQHSLYAGDPGIGYALVLAGMRCQNETWIKEGKRIFKRGIQRSKEKSFITDPTFGAGASGMSHLAHRMFELTNEKYLLKEKSRWMAIADDLYEHQFKDFELKIELKKTTQERIRLNKAPEATPACIHNSSLGLFLVKWVQEDLIDSKWDAMYGLSNPVTGEIL